MYWQLDSRARGNMCLLGNLRGSTASGQTARGFQKNIRAEASRRCTISHQGVSEAFNQHARQPDQLSRCTKLGDWRSLMVEGVSHLSTFSCCTKTGDDCALIGDFVSVCVVSHLSAEATKVAMGGIYFS